MQATRLSFLFILIFFSMAVKAAWITKTPQTITQPDGNVIHCFATGDEFYNWLHDTDGFTIIQSASNGYYSYANLVDGKLVPTQFIVGKTDPAETGLKPYLNISPEKMQAIRAEFIKKYMPEEPAAIEKDNLLGKKNKGFFTNLVVYIRFSDQPEYNEDTTTYTSMFNNTETNSTSLISYFRFASYNTLTIPSYFFPTAPGSKVISYQDIYPRKYFMPYNEVTNPDGYPDSERGAMEFALLKRAVASIASQVPEGLNLDNNEDGRVDNVVFIARGETTAWSTLLWPHRWSLSGETATIHGKRVWDFNLQLEAHLLSNGSSVLCHEMNHSLGAPDLYHYTSSPVDAIGTWDLMCSNSSPPQSMGAYMKFRYGGWIDQIPEITECGTYTLNPISSSQNNCYKLASPNSSSDFFVLEYRKREGPFETRIPGSGLLVYKINKTLDGQGNADGPPDEVYIYRPNGTLTIDGSISSAAFSLENGRTLFNDTTNPKSFLSNGQPAGIKISNISKIGETISFDVTLNKKPNAAFSASNTLIAQGCSIDFFDQSVCGTESWEWIFPGGSPSHSTDQNPKEIVYAKEGKYNVKLIAKNTYGIDSIEFKDFVIVSASVLSAVNFSVSDASICTGEKVTFTDNSKVCPKIWEWVITPSDGYEFVDETSSASQNPVVNFSKGGDYTVKLKVSNINGASELTKSHAVRVGGYDAYSYYGTFENGTLNELGWTIVNPDNKTTWDIFTVGGREEGSKAAGITLYLYPRYGQRDQLISPAFNLQEPGNYYLTFEHSYSQTNLSRSDSLIVQVSIDCGYTWTRIASLFENCSGNFATLDPVKTSYFPEVTEDWCGIGHKAKCNVIDMSSYQGHNNVKIMFEAVRVAGNNLFIDNIQFMDMNYLDRAKT